jgi:hypothetical protein
LYRPVDHRNPLDPPEAIHGYRQNALRYVIRDAARELDLSPSQAARLALILIDRGVAKWLRNRKVMLYTKHAMQKELRIADIFLRGRLAPKVREFLKGWRQSTNLHRQTLRRIGHSPRVCLGADRADARFIAALLKHGTTPQQRAAEAPGMLRRAVDKLRQLLQPSEA